MTFDRHCAAGERADALLASGDLDAARAAYDDLLDDIRASGTVDSFVMAKLTLGVLLLELERGDIGAAHGVWISRLDDSLYGLGIYALERGHTSVHDLIAYLMVSAFLHSRSLGDREAAADAVHDLMGRVTRYAAEEDSSLLTIALSNWRRHLDEVHDYGEVPARHLRRWRAAADRHGGVVSGDRVLFPQPAPWVITWRSGVAATFYPDGRVET